MRPVGYRCPAQSPKPVRPVRHDTDKPSTILAKSFRLNHSSQPFIRRRTFQALLYPVHILADRGLQPDTLNRHAAVVNIFNPSLGTSSGSLGAVSFAVCSKVGFALLSAVVPDLIGRSSSLPGECGSAVLCAVRLDFCRFFMMVSVRSKGLVPKNPLLDS